jgi:serine/threonine protein kinase
MAHSRSTRPSSRLPRLRDELLATACGADAARRARIQGWLDARAGAEAFFRNATIVREQAGAEVAATLVEARPQDPDSLPDGLPGSSIGRYRVLEKIGEGGCGTVYVAEQSEPVRRRVALKTLRPGMDTAKVLARFDMERQALALMDHPHIARVFEAGVSDEGRPYLVMELVHGLRITGHCDSQRLGLRQRLELFIQVCQAIQHAHQKGIIHRDIKPSNVLVSDQDGSPAPKVIDFGIARAVERRLTDETHATVQGQLLGTPAYMSPEQAEGGQDPDTRGDVYSLGVMLHELLTGRRPGGPRAPAPW